jgi:hypothetical protein
VRRDVSQADIVVDLDPASPCQSQGSPSLLSWDNMAAAGLLLPWLIAGYYALHLLRLPALGVFLPFLLVLAAVRFLRRRKRALPSPACRQAQRCMKCASVLTALLIAPPLAQAALVGWVCACHRYPTRFTVPDDAYDMMIARGLQQGFPRVCSPHPACSVPFMPGISVSRDWQKKALGRIGTFRSDD